MKKEDKVLYSFLKIIYTMLLKILYRPQVYGIENIPKKGPIIFIGNHKHAVDPTMIMMSTDRIIHFMAKEELFKGFHGRIFRKIGLIEVKRGKGNLLAVVQAEEILKSGGAVGIFPEGTRNKTHDELLKFKYGSAKIAQKTNSLIVPFAIRNEYKLFRKSVVLEFGKPIDISQMTIEQANEYEQNEVLKLLRK